MRELRAIAADLGVNVLMTSGMKGTRWLPHVSRALDTFIKPGQFTAVYYHIWHAPLPMLTEPSSMEERPAAAVSVFTSVTLGVDTPWWYANTVHRWLNLSS